jgi:hypothetical protein
MAKTKKPSAKAILEALRPSLRGLAPPKRTEPELEVAVAAVDTQASVLGVLEGFTSKQEVGGRTLWTGKGFNIVQLPNRNMEVSPPESAKFQVMMHAYSEEFVITRFDGDLPAFNRGNSQGDIPIHGLEYHQKIIDVATNLPIHAETGMWLSVADPAIHPSPMFVRQGVLPHGNTLLCQGFPLATHASGVPPFNVADITPFTLDAAGKRKNDSNDSYRDVIRNVALPTGITAAIRDDPNMLLLQHLDGTTIVDMDVLLVSALPIADIDRVSGVFAQVGAKGVMGNIPFNVKNANANSMTCIFWLETVRDQSGATFKQLQYSQTVILDFEVRDAAGVPTPIKWPHVSVATLREPGAPPL